MGIIEQNAWRNKAIFATILVMLPGLLFSRVLLSVGLFAFLALTILHKQIASQFLTFLKTPLLVLLSLLFFIPLISGLWSENTEEFLGVLRVKLPFLLLPLAFAGKWRFSDLQWQQLARYFILLVAIGCCWSLLGYIADMESINESYLRAKTIPTPLGDDHVRFSWMVYIATLLSLLQITTDESGRNRRLLVAALILFVIYLHVLSARTGVVMLYVTLICFLFYRLRSNRKQALTIMGLSVLLIAASWFFLPTLRNRVQYNLYDLSNIRNNTYHTGASDGNRVLSWKASWSILQQHPMGIGAGDIRGQVNSWYNNKLPEMKDYDRLYPSCEWLVYGNMAGWPGMLLFTLVMIYPLCIKNIRHRIYWVLLNLLAGLSFVIETSLEIQYGVFLYAFIVLWWWKWLRIEKNNFET